MAKELRNTRDSNVSGRLTLAEVVDQSLSAEAMLCLLHLQRKMPQ